MFTDEVDGIDGAFYKITDVKEDEPIFDELKSRKLGFESMNAAEHRHWPIGRGLYVNGGRNLSILINEQDHLRFISSQSNGEFGEHFLISVERKRFHAFAFRFRVSYVDIGSSENGRRA